MSLNQLIQDMGSQLQQLHWQDAPKQAAREEVEHLQNRLEQSSAALARRYAAIEELDHRLAEREHRAAWLASRVEIYVHVRDQPNAWRCALELDRLREAIEKDRAQLQKHCRIYQGQLAHFHHLQQRLADLQAKM